MSEPKVSVIIPVYNTEQYIAETLQCILAQTLSELEVIVVDDGSTDSSPAIIAEAAGRDGRIRIVTQSNKGLSEARNAGMEYITGKYAYFMDSDDLLERDALELCYEKCERDALDFVLFDADIFGDTSTGLGFDYYRAKYLEDRVYGGPELLDLLIDRRIYRSSVCLNFWRTAFLQGSRLTFRPGIIHEDELFTPQFYLSAQRVGIIPRTFFKRRVRPGSIMTVSFSRRNTDSYLKVAAGLSAYASMQPRPIRRIVRKTIRYFLNPALYNAYRFPLRDRLGLLGQALLHYPSVVRARSVAVLLFKKPLSKLRGR